MVGIFLSQDMARQLIFLLLGFCIGQCGAGVVPRNFKLNDVLDRAEEQSEVNNPVPNSAHKVHENASLRKEDEFNFPKLPSSNLSNLNGTENSSEIDTRSLSISTTLTTETPNSAGNASKESDISNQLSDFDQLEKGNMNGMKFDGDNDSTLVPASKETSVSTPNEQFRVELNGSDSNASSSVDRNDAESNSDVNFSGDISDGIEETLESLGPNIKVENLMSRNSGEVETPSDVNASEGIFSNLGFEFFSNSEVAKNAAMAMEVFNFTDSITDHIIEENEFHSFLDVMTPVPEDVHSSNSAQMTAQEQLNSTDVKLNGSESVKGFELFEDKNSTSSNPEHVEIQKETHDFLNLTEFENVNEQLELTNFTERIEDMNESLISNKSTITNETDVTEFENITEHLELTNFTEPMQKVNETLISNVSTITNETNFEFRNDTLFTEFQNITEPLEFMNFTELVEMNETLISNMSTLTNEIDFTEVPLAEVDLKNSTNAVPKCPPPGICLFWFLSQDACEVNSHCLGSRICCRIRCSKTCIEV